MYLVVGLGNPGSKYEYTRHNIGFQIIDRFAQKNGLNFRSSKKDYYYSEGVINSSEFFLVKPVSYMNMSGVPLLDFLEEHPVQYENILLLVDDVNLSVGDIRLRKSGSDGGHNGIKSIIYQLQSDSFPRLRFGIGSEFEKGEMAGFVLDTFKKKESELVERGLNFSVELIGKFISGGYKPMLDFYSLSGKKATTENDDSLGQKGEKEPNESDSDTN
ncbi:MAG: aminoacyl-tRNA hydrolase [Ignavibacteriae bacterium HGW-Ignavibacteriae-3]|nr:MAG: aminoacyl-tRNA hydrolase [Ignavibacteriae bacterium HGW-Ignavibacteriae-3]